MHDTPLPDASELPRPRVAAALELARRALVARPAATALDIAQGALLPVLQSLGVAVFELDVFRLERTPDDGRADYRLRTEGSDRRITVLPAGSVLSDDEDSLPTGTFLVTNGRHWLVAAGASSGPLLLDLFDAAFAEVLAAALLQDQGVAVASEPPVKPGRAGRDARLWSSSVGRVPRPAASPFAPITAEMVHELAARVVNMRGRLEAWFDDEPVDMTSRSAFYYVLAGLAVELGREDAIAGEDLVRPPDDVPEGARVRGLGRPGWFLLLDHEDHSVLEQRSAVLLDALCLWGRFTARQRGRPYPQP